LFDWISKRKTGISILTTVALIASAAGLPMLTITPDNRIFYGAENPYYLEFKKFEEDYSSNNNILFVLSGANPVYERDYATAIRWLTAQAWEIENVMRVDSLATYPLPISSGDTIKVAPILEATCSDSNICKRKSAEILNRPEIVNRLISADQKSTGVLATLFLEIGTVGEIERVNRQARSLADDFKKRFPGYEIVFTGGIPMMAAFAEASATDLATLLPIAALIMGLFLFAFLGGIKPTLILFLLGGSAAVITLGIAGWSGNPLNNATSIVPLIVFTLVIASSMHVVLHFQRSSGESQEQRVILSATKAALENNLPPLSISAATSIIGLLSLTLVDSPPLRQLGQLSAIGVAAGYMLTITILPIILSSLKRGLPSVSANVVQRLLNNYARTIENRRSYFLVGSLVAIVVLSGIPRLVIDDDFVSYFDQSTQFRTDTDRATKLLAGPNHIEILVNAGEIPSGVFDPDYLNFMKNLSAFVRTREQASNVHSYYDIIQSIAEAITPDKNAEEFEADEIAQLFLVYELSLEAGQSNTDFVNQSQTEARISVLLKETSSKDIQLLEKAISDAAMRMDDRFGVTITGENVPVAHISEINIRSMIYGLGGSMLFTAALVGIYFRKLRLAVTAFVAILVPVASGFGVWGWIKGEVGLASTAIVALTIGIVVDDAVHLIYRYLDGVRRMGLDSWQAAAHSVHRSGNAVTVTSIILVSGLSVLQFSSFKVNSSFGICTCLIIGLALLFDLFVLPRILVWTDR
jgi:predicted RND superfamily exporter protein